MLEDHDNGWIPNGSEMNLSGERQRLYYLHDELGSVTKVVGENGKTSAHYNYDEFGVPKPSVKFDQNWPGHISGQELRNQKSVLVKEDLKFYTKINNNIKNYLLKK